MRLADAPLNKQPNSQAIAFVVAVATSDLRSARGGGEHVFAYAPDESEATLSSAIKDRLSQGDNVRFETCACRPGNHLRIPLGGDADAAAVAVLHGHR